MSCDHNRTHFFETLGAEGRIAQAFGGRSNVPAAFERLFNASRRQPASDSEAAAARTKTEALFREMRAGGLAPPTHSTTGLPQADAQVGYAAVYDARQALRSGQPLGATAARVSRLYIGENGNGRTVAAPRQYEGDGSFRCPNCGRYASRTRPHVCPQTANATTMNRFLSRRLGVPFSAYDGGQIQTLLDEANANDGLITMRHALTGEQIHTTLDGSLVALMQGYAPAAWSGTTLVRTGTGQFVSVHQAGALETAPPATSAYQEAAARYGLDLMGDERVERLGLYRYGGQALASRVTSVGGGEEYDYGRFIGSEYRQRAAQGREVSAGDHHFRVGERRQGEQMRSSARTDDRQVVVGRTLFEAVGILQEARVTRRPGTSLFELWSYDRSELLAVYDADSRVVGQTTPYEGSPMTSVQMAAVIGAMVEQQEDEESGNSPFHNALAQELQAFRLHGSQPLAAADSAYLILSAELREGRTIRFGGTVSSEQCRQCGRFMGATGAHLCPVATEGQVPTGDGVPLTWTAGNAVRRIPFERPDDPDFRTLIPRLVDVGTARDAIIIEQTPSGYEAYRQGSLESAYDPTNNRLGAVREALPFLAITQTEAALLLHRLRETDPTSHDLLEEFSAVMGRSYDSYHEGYSAQIEVAARVARRIGEVVGPTERGYRITGGICVDCSNPLGEGTHHCRAAGRARFHEELRTFLNTATEQELVEYLPGVGRVRARQILRHREIRGGQFVEVVHATNALPYSSWRWVNAPPEERISIPTAEALEEQRTRRRRGQRLDDLPITDLNRASVEELTRLPGIGTTLAQRIVTIREERPFYSIHDLRARVERFGQLDERLGGRLIVGPSETAAAQGSVRQRVEEEARAIPTPARLEVGTLSMESFQQSYNAARERRANHQPPIPYMRQSATGGLGDRATGRGFGIEIEFSGGDTAAIGRDLYAAGLTSSPNMQGYHAAQRGRGDANTWSYERDGSVTGEIVSPVLYDTPETWAQLEQVCEIVTRHGGRADRRCGGHIHVGVSEFDHTPSNHQTLVTAFARNQDLFYRLSQNPTANSHRGTGFCAPIREPSQPYQSVSEPRESQYSRYVGLNWEGVRGGRRSDHVEFRTYDGSLDPGTIQAQVKLSLGMVAAARTEAGRALAAMEPQPHGHHRGENPRNQRLSGEAWERQTERFRTFVGHLFNRPEDIDQMTALFAVTKWQR